MSHSELFYEKLRSIYDEQDKKHLITPKLCLISNFLTVFIYNLSLKTIVPKNTKLKTFHIPSYILHINK